MLGTRSCSLEFCSAILVMWKVLLVWFEGHRRGSQPAEVREHLGTFDTTGAAGPAAPVPSWGLAQVCVWSQAPCVGRMTTAAQGAEGAQMGPRGCKGAQERGFLGVKRNVAGVGGVDGGEQGWQPGLCTEPRAAPRCPDQSAGVDWKGSGHLLPSSLGIAGSTHGV